MDLGLDIGPNMTGRKAVPVEAELVRGLEEADLALLATERGIKPQTVKKLRDSHHSLARALVVCNSDAEAALVTGYTPSRISVLKADPSFQELMEFYRKNTGAPEADYIARLTNIKMAAAEVILDKLEDDEIPVSIQDAIEAAKFASDRSGHGPQTKNTNVNVNVNLAERLSSARKRVGAQPQLPASAPDLGRASLPGLAPQIIEGTFSEVEK